MFELAYETPARWAELATRSPLELLSDHAHCELQAATATQALILKNPGAKRLVDALSVMAIEELRHFRRVVALLRSLGGSLGPAEPNPYAEGLRRASAGTRRSAFLDRLLVAGLIETRSHERFGLLADAPWEAGAAAELYAELLPSEAGHGRLFWELALDEFSEEEVASRTAELVQVEAEVVRGLVFAPRVHSGLRT